MKTLQQVAVVVALVVGVSMGQQAAAREPGANGAKFVSLPLGTAGGLVEDNLSAYLLAPAGSSDFVALDAGTLLAGLRKAKGQGSLAGITLPKSTDLGLEGYVLHHKVKAYLISHAHLDHVSGLAINATDDESKPIIGSATTIDYLRDHVFNWKLWPAFGDEGEGFQLKKYHYVRLADGVTMPIPDTEMTVEALPLSHSNGYPSTAFLIGAKGAYVLYCGDTGPDEVEKSTALQALWTRVAPLVRDKALRGIFLEASYPDNRPAKLLFGHLTPKWMMAELQVLAKAVDAEHPQTALKGLNVVVTHMKPSLKRGEDPQRLIPKQLAELNGLGINFIIPQQGQRLEL